MLSDDERVFFEVDDRQDNRRRRNGLELFRAVDQETFRFTEIDFGEVKFYFGAVVGTLRQMRREKKPLPPRRRRREACRRLRVLSSHRTQRGFRPAGAGLLSESERWISCRDGFRFEMNRRMFSVNLVNYDTENRNV